MHTNYLPFFEKKKKMVKSFVQLFDLQIMRHISISLFLD